MSFLLVEWAHTVHVAEGQSAKVFDVCLMMQKFTKHADQAVYLCLYEEISQYTYLTFQPCALCFLGEGPAPPPNPKQYKRFRRWMIGWIFLTFHWSAISIFFFCSVVELNIRKCSVEWEGSISPQAPEDILKGIEPCSTFYFWPSEVIYLSLNLCCI